MSPAELAWRMQAAVTAPVRDRLRRSPALPVWDRPGWLRATRALVESNSEILVTAAERIAGGDLQLWGASVRIDLRATDWAGNPLQSRPNWANDPKALWELHRQQHLVPLAAGAALSERESWARLGIEHLLGWIDGNPAGAGGAGWSSAYETAHRLVGWSVAVPLLLPWLQPEEEESISASYASQAAFAASRPSRFSSANNHRLAELTGLLAGAGLSAASLEWETVWSELEIEATRQTYRDGGSREQASGYFLYVLEILSTALFLASAAGRAAGKVAERAQAMVGWLDALADVDGEPPPVGDDAEDRMLRLDYFGERRGAAIAANVPRSSSPARASSQVLPESGYAVLRADEVRVVFDVGELGYGALAAHGHADALSVLIHDRGEPVARDSGTGTYVAGPEREWLRGTAAHNTIVVDGRSQAQSRGPHLWGRRYETRLDAAELSEAVDVVRASHDGYRGVVHTRSVIFAKPDLVIVLDRVLGAAPHSAVLVWQLAAGAERAEVVVASDPPATASEGLGLCSPRYGVMLQAPRATWTAAGRRIDFVTALSLAGQPLRVELVVDDASTTVGVTGRRELRIVECWSGAAAEVTAQ
jgi:hypothetical protein